MNSNAANIDCPFCSGLEPTLLNNESAQAFLSDPRKVPGHMLVTPKRHIEAPWELTSAELQDIFDLIHRIEKKLLGNLGDGCDIRQNYRPYVKQSGLKLNHVHFHVIPRSFNDYIYKVVESHNSDILAELPDEERVAVETLLQDA